MRKTALVTGASSGIGKYVALELNRRGYDLIIVARRLERLNILKKHLKGRTTVITADLSKRDECFNLYEQVKNLNVSVLVNNAGFGAIGDFTQIDLNRELEMIDTNCCAVQILTKLFLKDFVKKNYGYILNVASSAGLMPGGPLMSTYYASKSYVVSLGCGIYQELKSNKSRVKISTLCPGPVDTEFNDVAGCGFSIKGIDPKKCARIGVEGMFSGKMIITPERTLKLANLANRIAPKKLILKAVRSIQHNKTK